MLRKKYFLPVILLFPAFVAMAQENTVIIKGNVKNTEGTPLQGASIIINKKSVLSNKEGAFTMWAPASGFTVKITYQGYTPFFKKYNSHELKQGGNDTLKLSFVLQEKEEMLETVEIVAKDIEMAYKKPKILVLDYGFYRNGLLLLLKEKSKYLLRYTNENDSLVAELPLYIKPKDFFFDCLENYHVRTSDSIYQFYEIDNRLLLDKGIDATVFNQLVLPCVASSAKSLYFEKYGYLNQSLVYYATEKNNSQKKLIRHISDNKSMNGIMYSNAERWEELMSLPGRMADIDTGTLMHIRRSENALNFNKYVLSQEVYHPLFNNNKSLFIFDHLADSVVIYDLAGKPKEHYAIAHHKNKGWDKEILVDVKTNKFYAKCMRNGMVTLLELGKDFKVIREHKIEKHNFPEKMKIRNGYVYYLYNVKDGSSINNIYKQRLK